MKIKFPSLIFIASFAIVSCKKSSQSPNSGSTGSTEVDVYTCGNLLLTPSSPQATFWKNNVQTILTNNSSEVFDITSQNKDVYMVGDDSNGSCYWKNGTRVEIDDHKTGYSPTAITVQGNDVYTAGSSGNAAAYWKNGTITQLTNPFFSAVATGIAVNGNDVYVCGNYFSTKTYNHIPCYWKNGVLNLLSKDSTNSASARSIVVNGNDIHIIINTSVFDQNSQTMVDHILYWKNGVTTVIDKDVSSDATGFCVNGNDVYICGGENIAPYKAGYWKNGVFTTFPDIKSSQAIAIHGSDVYIAGVYSSGGVDYAAYWKNGTITQLNQTLTSYAWGITLVSK